MKRRRFLTAGSGVCLVGMSGCLGDDDNDEDERTEREDDQPGDVDDELPGDDEDDDTEPEPEQIEFEPSETDLVTIWATENDGSTDGAQIRLPLLEAGTYDFTVSWGDDTADAIQSAEDDAVTHTYDEPGEYEVRIDGTCEGWSFVQTAEYEQTGDANKLVEIQQWGDFEVGLGDPTLSHDDDLAAVRTDFAGASNMDVTAQDTPVIGPGATLQHLFANTAISTDTGLADWDVSTVEHMGSLFKRAGNFDADLRDWDVSSVETMELMFRSAASFQGDLNDWDVSNVESMHGMFMLASDFDSDLNEWDVSNVEDFSAMFGQATSFDGDVSDWNVSNATDMNFMFGMATSFNGDVSDWDVSNAEDMGSMFHSAESFDGDLSDWDVSNVENMFSMFSEAPLFEGDISDWDVSNVENMDIMFRDGGLTRENYDEILLNWQHLNLQEDVAFGAGDTQYSSGPPAEAREFIRSEFGWFFSDGGEA